MHLVYLVVKSYAKIRDLKSDVPKFDRESYYIGENNRVVNSDGQSKFIGSNILAHAGKIVDLHISR